MFATRDDVRQQRREARERFANAEKLEAEYLRALRMLTRQVDHIVKGMAPGGVVKNPQELQRVLREYSAAISPWAKSVAEKMLFRIAKKDATSWMRLGNEIGRSLREELQSAPTGEMLRDFLAEQVKLIESLPLEAAERVHRLTQEGMIQGGRRADEIAKDILATGKVTESRAKLIARTEIARTASGITMARAKYVGSTHYVWRTSNDPDVRASHEKMNNTIIPWDAPPEVEPGKRYHAGMFPNCRCWCQPILFKD